MKKPEHLCLQRVIHMLYVDYLQQLHMYVYPSFSIIERLLADVLTVSFVNICDNCMSLTRTVAPAPNFMYRTDVKYSDANTNFSADGIDLLRAVGIIKSPHL